MQIFKYNLEKKNHQYNITVPGFNQFHVDCILNQNDSTDETDSV